MYCNKCGKQVDGSTNFCVECGNILEYNANLENKTEINEGIQFNSNNLEDNNVKTEKNFSKNKNFVFILIIVSLIGLLICIFTYVYLSSNTTNTYNNEYYSINYPLNWTRDNSKYDLLLYYKDNKSVFKFNGSSKLSATNYDIENSDDKKAIYDEFYNIWEKTNNIKLLSGSETFYLLNEDFYYAYINYESDYKFNGALYILVSKEYDLVLTFFSQIHNSDYAAAIDNDVIKILKSIDGLSNENNININNNNQNNNTNKSEFVPQNLKEYTAIGYMNYQVPDCWIFDDNLSSKTQYKSNVFKFKDNVSMLSIKASTIMNNNSLGTSYEQMKSVIEETYGPSKNEEIKYFNGQKWYVFTTNEYTLTNYNNNFYGKIYFTLSKSSSHIYYYEAYIDYNIADKAYIESSIEYIINSAELKKLDD